jgi:hypothetical protein
VRVAVPLLVFILAGCGTTAPSGTPNPTSLSSSGPTAPSQTAASIGPVAIDPSLLEHLPAQIDGLDVIRSADSDAAAVADPVVSQFGEGVVTALAIDAAAGDFAYATVVRLRPDAFSAELYRSWRDSFDQGACSQAGGVVRTAVTQISGREVHIDTCAGGLRTYHAWLPNSRILVSISSAGERKLGELLVQGLRD